MEAVFTAVGSGGNDGGGMDSGSTVRAISVTGRQQRLDSEASDWITMVKE
jgi:hypothetical protein